MVKEKGMRLGRVVGRESEYDQSVLYETLKESRQGHLFKKNS